MSSQQIPLYSLTLNLAEVLEGGHCLCIVSGAGPIVISLLLILTFTFLRLVIVLMKDSDKQIIETKGCVRA